MLGGEGTVWASAQEIFPELGFRGYFCTKTPMIQIKKVKRKRIGIKIGP
jgi:hypothetical protein